MGKKAGGRNLIIDRESPSSVIKMARVTNESDDADNDFGDFSTADKPVSNGNHEPSGGGNDDHDDDDFGDFASSTLENNQQGGKFNTTEEQTPETPAGTDWGDFGSAPTSMTNLASNETSDDGAQASSKGLASLPDDGPPKTNTSPSSSTADYDTAHEEEDDEDFGAFDGPNAPAPAPSPTPTPSPTPAAPVVDETPTTDGFGDFGSAPKASKPSSSADLIERKPTEETFGGFDGPVTGTTDAAPAAPATATTETSAEDNDFGDFGGCDSGETDVVAPGPVAAATTTAEPLAEDDDFGDFGDFDSAPPSGATDAVAPAPVPAAATTATTTTAEEDDFGDFGDFDSAPASGTAEATARTSAQADTTTETPAEEDDFGDFGDFDSAPASGTAETAAPVPAVATATTPAEEDDFGDFGDFDNAPAAAGNKTPLNDTPVPPQPRPQPSAESSDPVLQKATTVFSKVFERFKLEDSSDGKSDASETIAVAKLTASMDSQYEGITSEKLVNDFRTILNEMQKEESPPVFIVAVGERYSPNAHFSVPIDGESFGPGAGTQQLESSVPQQQQVPPAQSQTQNSANASRPQSSSTMVQLPPQTNTASGRKQTDGEQLSEKAQRLLRQVPDLSFMLQSKLLLRSNVK